MVNVAASASHSATDRTKSAMRLASNSRIVVTTHRALPSTVAATSSARPDTTFAAMKPARDSGLVSISTAVPARRSDATVAAPVMMMARSATWARLPRNCR